MSLPPPLAQWALPRLQQLLPLDDESLREVLQYACSLPKDAGAEHLRNLLGDEPKALEFIEGLSLRRLQAQAQSGQAPAQGAQAGQTSASGSFAGAAGGRGGAVAGAGPVFGGRGGRGGKKKKIIHALPARLVEGHGDVRGGYVKRDDEDYMPRPGGGQHAQGAGPGRQTHKDAVAKNLALREEQPDATQKPLITDDASLTNQPITAKAPPPSAAGMLAEDALKPPPAKKGGSSQSSRNASPAPKATKINIAGGTPMHGASTNLSDLDSAIRSLELQTNPTLAATSDPSTPNRACNCMATRHPLLDMAPNCLSCGKIICVLQGLGPCTHCGAALLSPDDIAKVLRVLKDERGGERMKSNNASQRRPEVAAGKQRALTGRDFLVQHGGGARKHTTNAEDAAAAADAAKAHRDRLLEFQAHNARRTQIHDEAADYDVPSSGTSMWASPAERAKQLKAQQKVLREVEWNARPEWEKKKVVASIDLKAGKVVRKMAAVERPEEPVEEERAGVGAGGPVGGGSGAGFGNNPLAKGLVRPMAKEGKGKGKEGGGREQRSQWRRVQMDEDDSEQWILDGGMYGGDTSDRRLGAEEHAIGGGTGS